MKVYSVEYESGEVDYTGTSYNTFDLRIEGIYPTFEEAKKKADERYFQAAEFTGEEEWQPLENGYEGMFIMSKPRRKKKNAEDDGIYFEGYYDLYRVKAYEMAR